MNARQTFALRNCCDTVEAANDEQFSEQSETRYGTLVTLLRVSSNPMGNTNVWYASVAIYNNKSEALQLSKLPRAAIRLLMQEADKLLFGVGLGEPTKIIGSIGLHVVKSLTNDEEEQQKQELN
jgi:hypothetical protein